MIWNGLTCFFGDFFAEYSLYILTQIAIIVSRVVRQTEVAFELREDDLDEECNGASDQTET